MKFLYFIIGFSIALSLSKPFLLLSGLSVVASIFAQAPEGFKYQAVARDGSGSVMANTRVNFRISILQGTLTGTSVYSERHLTTTNEFGLVNLEIGKGIVDSGIFGTINWGADAHFIKVEMEPSGGNSFQFLGTSQLLSVPDALHAKTVETGDNRGSQTAATDATLNGNGTTSNPLKIGQQAATSGQVLKWNGTAWVPAADERGTGGSNPTGPARTPVSTRVAGPVIIWSFGRSNN